MPSFAWVSVTTLSPYLFVLSTGVAFVFWEAPMGRTIPSWRIIVEQEIAVMSRFKQFLGPEERAVFDDLLNQCKLYAPYAGCLASPVKEVPLLLSMIFGQHKKLAELEKRLREDLDRSCERHF